MEDAFLIPVGVMAIMTVEITVTKMDVSDGRWEETRSLFYFLQGLDTRTEQNISSVIV